MINTLIEGLYDFLFGIVGTFTSPISSFLNQNFPDVSYIIVHITTFINSLNGYFAWFIHLLPTYTRVAFLAFLATVILCYPGMIVIELAGKSLDVIKRVWPFGGK